MIEVFITDIKSIENAEQIVAHIEQLFPKLKVSFDIDETQLPFPCGHTVIKIEGIELDNQQIISTVNQLDFLCEIMKDKVCVPN